MIRMWNFVRISYFFVVVMVKLCEDVKDIVVFVSKYNFYLIVYGIGYDFNGCFIGNNIF